MLTKIGYSILVVFAVGLANMVVEFIIGRSQGLFVVQMIATVIGIALVWIYQGRSKTESVEDDERVESVEDDERVESVEGDERVESVEGDERFDGKSPHDYWKDIYADKDTDED